MTETSVSHAAGLGACCGRTDAVSGAAGATKVVAAIAAERPAFLFMTGDLTFDGSSPGKWAAFDALVEPVRAAGFPAFAALSNHEYWDERAGERLFFARFPHLAGRRWYALAWGPIRLVVLDSNPDPLGEQAWAEQKAWYERTLAEIDGDHEARGPWCFSTARPSPTAR